MTLTTLIATFLVYSVAGVFAGLISGIMGIGGGIIVVPALLFIFQYNPAFPPELLMHMAAGSSLAIMLFTSQASIRAHHKLASIQWSLFNNLWPGIILGALSGAFLANQLPTHLLKIFFGLFLLFVVYKMLRSINFTKPHSTPARWINALVSYVIGLKSGLLGVGGGTLIIPYLNYCGVAMKTIAPISALCTLTVAIIGTMVFIFTGWSEPGLPAYSTGYIYWPAVLPVALFSSLFAPLGAKLTYVLPVKQLTYGFVTLLFFTALGLLF